MPSIRRWIFAILFTFSCTSFARAPLAERMVVDTGDAQLQGYRFLNPDGRPGTGKAVVFAHGLASNLHEFEYLIPLLMAAGYDCYAFNFRGHGNGGERSLVKNYQPGDYQLEKMATADFPAIIGEVQRLHPGKVIVIGHSMGGMVPRGSFHEGTVSEKQIESMILLGSPPHFNGSRASRQIGDFFGLGNVLHDLFGRGAGNEDVSLLRAGKNFENAMDLFNVFSVSYWIAKGMMASIVKSEMKRVLGALGDVKANDNWPARAMSANIPKDILRSFERYSRGEDYPYANVKIPVPVLYIVGETDLLVSASSVASHTSVQSEEGGYWLARVSGVGHLGLVAPKAADAYSETLFNFLNTSPVLGTSHRSVYAINPDKCVNRLTARGSQLAVSGL